jgi:hypothetical protein
MSEDLYALLIAVDCYLPNRLNDGRGWYNYPSLSGCVRDVSHVEAYLREHVHVPGDHIVKLTSTNTGAERPPEPAEQWPTYDNIVAAFRRVAAMAQPGDQVYVHYSGHGGRATTKWPKLKGEKGWDETLAPMDIGNSTARYLRDIEIAHLVREMTEKGLIVTMVLDSCHSGGATRQAAPLAAVRGTGRIDATERPAGSAVAADADLAETWAAVTGDGTRNARPGAGWLPTLDHFVLLAACRPTESAQEYAFDGVERNGALTYWLLDTLQDAAGPGLSYKALHDRVQARVHAQFADQTPMLQGDGDRQVFGVDRVATRYEVVVTGVDGDRVVLQAGQAQGLKKGAQFSLYAGAAGVTAENRLALAEVDKVGAANSEAEIVKRFRSDPVEIGALAVLEGPSSQQMVRKVAIHPCVGAQARAAIDKAIRDGDGWVELGEPADYTVSVGAGCTYAILDRAGVPVANLRPPIGTGEANAAKRVAARLSHLARYHGVHELHNHSRRSPMARKVTIELAGHQADYMEGDLPDPQPFDPDEVPTVGDGEWVFLRVRNDMGSEINVSVLDLQPDWGITQIYPWEAGESPIPVAPGMAELLPISMFLPSGYEEGTDAFKVFATTDPSNFRWLELPALDRPVTRSAALQGAEPQDELEEMLAAFTADQPTMRNARPAAFPARRWVAHQVEVRVIGASGADDDE